MAYTSGALGSRRRGSPREEKFLPPGAGASELAAHPPWLASPSWGAMATSAAALAAPGSSSSPLASDSLGAATRAGIMSSSTGGPEPPKWAAGLAFGDADATCGR